MGEDIPTRGSAGLSQIARLRLLVGYLGERAQFGWWPTEFYSASSGAFLTPVFQRTAALAQYHGVREAAQRVHDEHIGVGRVFHLFRRPENLEQSLFEHLPGQAPAAVDREALASKEAALSALEASARSLGDVREGPVQIGTRPELDTDGWIKSAAAHYHCAFVAGARAYPYFTEET